MPVSSSSSPLPRPPSFLAGKGQAQGATGAAGQPALLPRFGGSAKPGEPKIVPFFERPDAEPPPPPAAAAVPAMEPPPEIEPLAPPLPPIYAQPTREMSERLARAVRDLGETSQRLAEQSASDALEIGLLVARRILEAELSTSTAALPSLIRSALRRLGEARRIVVRLCPADAAAALAAGELAALGAPAAAAVEVRGDGSLAAGDCIIDGDESTVDGRLGARLEEVRRILNAALADESHEGTP